MGKNKIIIIILLVASLILIALGFYLNNRSSVIVKNKVSSTVSYYNLEDILDITYLNGKFYYITEKEVKGDRFVIYVLKSLEEKNSSLKSKIESQKKFGANYMYIGFSGNNIAVEEDTGGNCEGDCSDYYDFNFNKLKINNNDEEYESDYEKKIEKNQKYTKEIDRIIKFECSNEKNKECPKYYNESTKYEVYDILLEEKDKVYIYHYNRLFVVKRTK